MNDTIAMPGEALHLEASDVTETHAMTGDFQGETPSAAVAKVLASRMSLPMNVPYGLIGHDGAFLDDDAPIGIEMNRLGAQSRLTVAPKTHLG